MYFASTLFEVSNMNILDVLSNSIDFNQELNYSDHEFGFEYFTGSLDSKFKLDSNFEQLIFFGISKINRYYISTDRSVFIKESINTDMSYRYTVINALTRDGLSEELVAILVKYMNLSYSIAIAA